VTVGDKHASGEVIFISSEGNEYKSPLNPQDGSYKISGAPVGTHTVVIKGMGATGLQGAPVGGTKPPKDMKMPDMPEIAVGVPPPARYADPKTSGLTIEVTGGDQTQDFTLTEK
jgi:hypothetical protein